MSEPIQSEINIGTLGHVDHGKTTLTKAITGVWTDTHSESIKRSMTIKLGYADAVISKCDGCEGAEAYTTSGKCEGCGGEARPVRRISILDAPGHETLMATAIAGSNIIDAALFVISAAEHCPMPQTKEHLALLNVLGIRNIIIAQTKIDIAGKEKTMENYNEIKKFVEGSVASEAPIIPVAASKGINIGALLEAITGIPVPQRDLRADPVMYIARSFDVNRPGTPIGKIVGGVVGGSMIRGEFKVGDEIEIRPGINTTKEKGKKAVYKPVMTRIVSLSTSRGKLERAMPGGLIAIGTEIDPEYTKADGLVGNVVGKAGKLPDVLTELSIEYKPIQREDMQAQMLKESEPIILGIGTATAVGRVKSVKRNRAEVELTRPVCIDSGAKISVLRNISQRWRLSGYAKQAE